MSAGYVETHVSLLKSACPLCGCEAYDDDEPSETAILKFTRRVAWAAQAFGIEVVIRFKQNDASSGWTLISIEPKGSGR